MVQAIKNRFLSIAVKKHGAELCSLKSLKNNKEYLWQADPAYWGKHAPVLFPIIGCLKNNTYRYDGKAYEMTRHGFARDYGFELVEKKGNKLKYRLLSNENTLLQYPFEFEFCITYELMDEKLDILYEVKNKGDKEMYFSLGAHPAFNCNMMEGDKYLDFDQKVTLDTYVINTENGLIEKGKKRVLEDAKELLLTYDLFKSDALVFDSQNLDTICIRDNTTNEAIKMTLNGFPYLGIWTPEAPFLCLEPWYGIADFTDTNGNIKDKTGIQNLGGNETFKCRYQIEILN